MMEMASESIENVKEGVPEDGAARHRNKEILNVFNSFIHNEATGGILLLICTIAAVLFASFPGGEWLERLWGYTAGIEVGSFSIRMTVKEWINDGLMAIFFLSVGLEIKREMLVGQLSSFKRSILPIMGALGGMVVPALIYSIFNHADPQTAHGWGIPMATDIAFAVGILSLLGKRVPASLKVFLTALAIVDDLGSIVVLAIFYPTHALHLTYLLYVAGIMVFLLILNRAHINNGLLYIIPGIFMWYFTYKSGIHATISGVLLAMVIPSKGKINELRFQTKIEYLLKKFRGASNDELQVLTNPEQQHIIHNMYKEIKDLDPLLHVFESRLHPIATYLIVPLFALSNAGVAFDLSPFAGGHIPGLTLGIFFGLLIGKPLGIFFFSWLGIKCKLAAKPANTTWIQLAAITVLGGIGFTMSIFVNGLAFKDPILTDLGKISILITSTTAAIAGFVALILTCRKPAPELTAAEILPQKNNHK